MTYKATTRSYILIALVVSLGFSVYTATRPKHEFPTNQPGPSIVVTVTDGEYGLDIAKDLEAKGIIKEAATFVALANIPANGAQAISPGNHKIQSHISSRQALEQLLDRTLFTHMINVIEGSTKSDVLVLLKKDSTIKQSASVNVGPYLQNSRNSVEGQLFPASYTFAPGTTTNQALKAMVDRFGVVSRDVKLSDGYLKFTPYQVLTIASMVQIEGDPADYSKVAGVIYNRLRINMPLQLNSTVQFAAGLRGKISLSTAATKFDSPYNTYKYLGLPPTPISNPGRLAIEAALNPVKHDFLYFVTVKPRDTRFTKDYNEFEKWVTEYNRNRAAGAFK